MFPKTRITGQVCAQAVWLMPSEKIKNRTTLPSLATRRHRDIVAWRSLKSNKYCLLAWTENCTNTAPGILSSLALLTHSLAVLRAVNVSGDIISIHIMQKINSTGAASWELQKHTAHLPLLLSDTWPLHGADTRSAEEPSDFKLDQASAVQGIKSTDS